MRNSNTVVKIILLSIIGFAILPNPQADAKKVGLWECSIEVFGTSYYGRALTEGAARQKASKDCSQSQHGTNRIFCSARSARCNKAFGVGFNATDFNGASDVFENMVLINATESLSQCSQYEAYCSGIGGSSGYGSTVAEAKNNMPVSCIPVSVRCVSN